MVDYRELVKQGFEVKRFFNVFGKTLNNACVKDLNSKVEIYEILNNGKAIYFNTIYKK